MTLHPDSGEPVAAPGTPLRNAVPVGTGAVENFIAYLKGRLKMHHDMAATERHERLVAEVLGAIDRADSEAFLAALDEDCEFRFASSPALHGRAAIGAMLGELLAATDSIAHHCQDVWPAPGHVVVRGTVDYLFKDGTAKTVPFCDVWRLNEAGRIARYDIYCDMNV